MKTMTDFAVHMAERIRDTERGLDQTIADTSLMIHDMTRHRAGAGISAQVGHQALLEASAATAALADARSRVLKVHELLYRDALRLHVDPAVLVGPETKPNDRPKRQTTGLLEKT